MNCLSDGRFHSGETLGKTLGLTRSGVWKLIQQCRHLNISLHSVTNKGYQLEHPLTLLDKEALLKQLSPSQLSLLKTIEIFDTLPSTNDYLMTKIHQPLETHPGNWVCLAEHQSQGKGRQGRHWFSPYGKNLYFSILWRFNLEAGELSGLSLATALAVVKTLEQHHIPNLGVKWPNDILWQSKKLAGILIELSAEAHSVSNAVIGIGINVAMPISLGDTISQPWTDLEQITGHYIDRNILAGNLLNQLMQTFALFQNQGLSPFINEWQERDLALNQPLTLTTAKGILQGTGRGINDKGHLLIEMKEGHIQTFASGEVSIQVSH